MKNIVLKTITCLVALTWMISACSLDSSSWIPTIVCMASTAYLLLFLIANLPGEDDEDAAR